MNLAMEATRGQNISLSPEHLMPAAEQLLDVLRQDFAAGARASWFPAGRYLATAALVGVVLGGAAFVVSAPWAESKSTAAKDASIVSQPAAAERHRLTSAEKKRPVVASDQAAPSGEQDEAVSEDDALPPLKGLTGRRRRYLSLAHRTAGIDRHSGLYRRLLVRGWKRLSAGKYRKAAVTFSRAVNLKPGLKDAYYGLALALFEQKHENAALSVIRKAQKQARAGAEIWLLAGSAYQFLGHERMARKMYEQYLKKAPRGRFARDVKTILAYKNLPPLYE